MFETSELSNQHENDVWFFPKSLDDTTTRFFKSIKDEDPAAPVPGLSQTIFLDQLDLDFRCDAAENDCEAGKKPAAEEPQSLYDFINKVKPGWK